MLGQFLPKQKTIIAEFLIFNLLLNRAFDFTITNY